MTSDNLPLISVLIPAYNHEKYITDTILSIIAQTYLNLELLIIDDGSKDSTWEIISDFEKKCLERFKNISFNKQKNRGVIETINRMLEKAQGEYVYIIASDDMAKPQAIEKLYNFLSKNQEYALAVGDNEIINAESKRIFWDKNCNAVYSENMADYLTFGSFLQAAYKEVDFYGASFGSYSSLLKGNYIPNGYLIRKNIFMKTGYYTNNAPLEDYYMMMQIAKYGKMKFFDEILFSYRWHDSNTVKNKEHMIKITQQTKDYEIESIFKNGTEQHKQMVNAYLSQKKYKFRILGILSLYRMENQKNNPRFLELFGYRIKLSKDAK